MSHLDNGFSKAQRAYENMMPEESINDIPCEECDGTGVVYIDDANDPCPVCKGDGSVAQSQAEKAQEIEDERAARMRDEEIDRKGGLYDS